jgi:hypothetical protein
MYSKISPTVAVKEAMRISWERKWSFLGLFLLLMVAIMSLQVLAVMVPDAVVVAGVLMAFITPFAQLVFIALFCHLVITHMRGDGRIMPDPFWTTIWRVFIRGLLLFLLTMGVLVVVMGPVVAVLISQQPGGGELGGGLGGLMIVGFLVAYALIVALFLRLGVMIPGASVGHVMSLKEAWAMTKGHGWRMFGSVLMVAVVSSIVALVFMLPFFVSVDGEEPGMFVFISLVPMMCVALMANVVFFVLMPVWYEKLRLRHEASNWDDKGTAVEVQGV